MTDVLGLLALLAVGWVGFGLLVTGLCLYRLTHPPRRTYATAQRQGRPGDPGELAAHEGGPRGFGEWTFRAGSRSLPAWDVKGDDPEGPVVILTHGWGDSRLGGLSRLATAAAVASRVIVWDMPGHGTAPGASALGLREGDHLRALIHTLDDRVETQRPLVLWGWSLGAGVSIDAAATEAMRQRVIAVIAEAPYRLPQTPARNVLALWGLPRGWSLAAALMLVGLEHRARGWTQPGGRFDRAERARSLSAPLLVLHGDQDDVCPIADGEAIARAAPCGVLEPLRGCGHHGVWTSPDARTAADAAVRGFLASALRARPRE